MGDAALTQRMLDQIQVQVQILSQLSQEMMELAQIESGQVLLKLERRGARAHGARVR